MSQSLFGAGIGATGIVGVLIVAGILLKIMVPSAGAGDAAIIGGTSIGIGLGLLGVFAVAKRTF